MTVSVFASGSGGNCLLVSGVGTNILIDAGISMRRVKSALAEAQLNVEDIGGVLITHEHSDHVSGLKMLCRHYALPVFAPHTVANRLAGKIPEIEENLHIIPVNEDFYIENLKIRAFRTPHDTDESVGYRVEGEGIFALGTDMGHVTQEVMDGLMGAETVLIESNHDERLLIEGPYPAVLKRRILSDNGHLSNSACACLAKTLSDNGTENIILGHLSRENNRPAIARAAAEAALGTDRGLFVAPELGFLQVPVGKAVQNERD